MNKKLIIALAVLILIVLGLGVITLMNSANTAQQGGQTTGGTFPSSGKTNTNTGGGTAGGMTIKDVNGNSVPVTNFETKSSTVRGPGNNYYLSGGANVQDTKAPYQIFYDPSSDYFGVTLYQEPFGKYRAQAEQELMTDLGITKIQMCNLNYDVSVGPGVSDVYGQENLGFSFCPGATQLPS